MTKMVGMAVTALVLHRPVVCFQLYIWAEFF
jgi:hypothetical protein